VLILISSRSCMQTTKGYSSESSNISIINAPKRNHAKLRPLVLGNVISLNFVARAHYLLHQKINTNIFNTLFTTACQSLLDDFELIQVGSRC